MYVPRVLHPHSTERMMLACEDQQSYGTMDNTCSQAEGIISYSAGPAVIEHAPRGSLWMPRTNTRWSTWSRFRRTNSPLPKYSVVFMYSCLQKRSETIHCVVCSCAQRLKSRCLGTDCFPGCLHTVWNKRVERRDADPQGLHLCPLITCLMKITYAAYMLLATKANAAITAAIYLLK